MCSFYLSVSVPVLAHNVCSLTLTCVRTQHVMCAGRSRLAVPGVKHSRLHGAVSTCCHASGDVPSLDARRQLGECLCSHTHGKHTCTHAKHRHNHAHVCLQAAVQSRECFPHFLQVVSFLFLAALPKETQYTHIHSQTPTHTRTHAHTYTHTYCSSA